METKNKNKVDQSKIGLLFRNPLHYIIRYYSYKKLNWINITKNPGFLSNNIDQSIKTIIKYINKIDKTDIQLNPYYILSLYNTEDFTTIKKYENILYDLHLYTYKSVSSDDNILNNPDLDWARYCMHPNFLTTNPITNYSILDTYWYTINPAELLANKNILLNPNIDENLEYNIKILKKYYSDESADWYFIVRHSNFLPDDITKKIGLINMFIEYIDFEELSKISKFLSSNKNPDEKLSENIKIINEYIELIDWNYLSKNINFLIEHNDPKIQIKYNSKIIKKYYNYINWYKLFKNPMFLIQNNDPEIQIKYNDKIIKKYEEYSEKDRITKNNNFLIYYEEPDIQFAINNELIEKYNKLIIFDMFFKNKNFITCDNNINDEIINKYINKIDFTLLSKNSMLSIDTINKYHDKLDFEVLCANEFNEDPIVFERKKKYYSNCLIKDLKRYYENKLIKYYKIIYDCCIHELKLQIKGNNWQNKYVI